MGSVHQDNNAALALDAATKLSGYSFWKDGKLDNWGTHESKDPALVNNILDMKKWVLGLVKKLKPAVVFYEDIQLQCNVSVFKALAKLQGVLECLLAEKDIPCVLVPSSTWKSHCGVKGKTRKEQKINAIARVKELYGVDASTDEADAILLGRYGNEGFSGSDL